jgi:hypothetical protein
LVRYTHGAKDAIVVGLLIGRCRTCFGYFNIQVQRPPLTHPPDAAVIPPAFKDILELGTLYDVFQHISVVQAAFGLAVELPQPPPHQ